MAVHREPVEPCRARCCHYPIRRDSRPEETLNPIAFDLETHPIKHAGWNSKGKPSAACMLAPRVVCASFAGIEPVLLLRDRGLKEIARFLSDENRLLVGHNDPFDLGCVLAEAPDLKGAVFDALAAGHVSDTMVRERLLDIAKGVYQRTSKIPEFYSLGRIAARRLGRELDKGADSWRTRYAELDGVPVEDWPIEAVAYSVEDARATLDVWTSQRDEVRREGRLDGRIPLEDEEVRASWALHLVSLTGMRTDPIAVKHLREQLEREVARDLRELRLAGLVRADGKVDDGVKRRRVAASGSTAKTESGKKIAAGAKVLRESGDPTLGILARYLENVKLLGTYFPPLEARIRVPVGARYSLAGSFRSTSSGPNDQNPPREGGIRECHVPRPGHVFVSADYDTVELRAWADSCILLVGFSKLAEEIRRGDDVHLSLAAEILGISYDEALSRKKAGEPRIKAARQFAKEGNFGFPGGMGWRKFLERCRLRGIVMTAEQAKSVLAAWRKTRPEQGPFFRHIGGLEGVDSGTARVVVPQTGFVRGGLFYSEAANTYFQSPTAAGAKRALFAVAREQHCDLGSALYGSRTVAFLHDELVLEALETRADATARRLAEVMVREMSSVIRNVPITCKPVITRRWYKGTEPLERNGRLVPVRPRKLPDGREIWEEDCQE